MFRTNSNFRLVVEIICGVALLVFIGGIMLVAAATVGWLMVLGMMIPFTLEFISRIRDR